ncbi:hypothetical protein M409DRAFT_18301 [Zasmidium cellare ATCC 36951]|uniref:FAD-binding domain-containing protein n=1 Tax=Zasmidium cellare ATCC 36951 TaxID=1080233 RepID=A0A6A6CVL7_ZASCE|nr:uncharacterized protein M409DRAFT_18301 [Zasmidium cellare ATCC 36951]KAF2171184.1 hypothetical protein M409DRAFT_18301 [Zasmidium cellare ATCC 36951]
MALKIAIIGAGPAGCMLARLLTNSPDNHNISVTIFEGEASLNFRSQGGSLDLHDKTGQAALKKAGLFDEFLKHARYDGEALKLCDKNLLCYVKQSGGNTSRQKLTTGRPEIDRPKLRELLFNSLPKGTVEWSKKLTHIDRDTLTLHFADGTSQSSFDLIVGADGAWSKVRPLLTPDKPFYSGIAGHTANIPNALERYPDLHSLINRGSVFAFSDGKSLAGQQQGDGSLNISTWSVHAPDWQSTYDVHDGAQVKAAARRAYATWDPRLLALIEAAEDSSFIPRDLYMLPVGNCFSHVKGLTLIGDAAHLMTPFAGEGVNLAFEDSMRLSEAIIRASSSSPSPTTEKNHLDEQILTFERDMFTRAKATQEMTYKMLSLMFLTENAPRSSIERYIITAVEGELGPMLTVLVTPLVYVWFFVFKLIY